MKYLNCGIPNFKQLVKYRGILNCYLAQIYHKNTGTPTETITGTGEFLIKFSFILKMKDSNCSENKEQVRPTFTKKLPFYCFI